MYKKKCIFYYYIKLKTENTTKSNKNIKGTVI